MGIIKFFLIFSILIVFYTYIGYALIIQTINFLSRKGKVKLKEQEGERLPDITLVVAAYNEQDCIEDKILNSYRLKYPKELLKLLFITDGSTDGTNEIIKKYPDIIHLFQQERKGKIAATKRAMKVIDSEIVVFSDANTSINEDALQHIVKHYQDSQVGGVACEKRVNIKDKDNASGSGEGFYWKYESHLKQQDSDFYSVVGAAGELFSIKTTLFEEIPSDSIIEDFYLTAKIAEKGYVIRYEPQAFAVEEPSYSIAEEYKRKTRIAAGGVQSIIRLTGLLNPLKNPKLSFIYVSHRVLRWMVTPFLLPMTFLLSIILMFNNDKLGLILGFAQVIFYVLAMVGWLLRNKRTRIKIFYIPFYFSFMNYCVFVGTIKYLRGNQSVIWEKSIRNNGSV